jgi:putative integral membrane protein (TIGR02587 family)
MEVWWIGSSASPSRLLGVLLTTLLGTYLLSRTTGFHKAKSVTEREAIGSAIEAIALGLTCATLMLVILREITLDTSLSEAIGKIIFESVPFSIGVALANQFLQNSDKKSDNHSANNSANNSGKLGNSSSAASSKKSAKSKRLPSTHTSTNHLNETVSDIGATLLGALIIAFSIAPTDEVITLVAAIDGLWLMLIVLVSLVLSYGIVFQANFTRQGQRLLHKGLFQSPLSETIFSYLLSFLLLIARSFWLRLSMFQPLPF